MMIRHTLPRHTYMLDAPALRRAATPPFDAIMMPGARAATSAGIIDEKISQKN